MPKWPARLGGVDARACSLLLCLSLAAPVVPVASAQGRRKPPPPHAVVVFLSSETPEASVRFLRALKAQLSDVPTEILAVWIAQEGVQLQAALVKRFAAGRPAVGVLEAGPEGGQRTFLYLDEVGTSHFVSRSIEQPGSDAGHETAAVIVRRLVRTLGSVSNSRLAARADREPIWALGAGYAPELTGLGSDYTHALQLDFSARWLPRSDAFIAYRIFQRVTEAAPDVSLVISRHPVSLGVRRWFAVGPLQLGVVGETTLDYITHRTREQGRTVRVVGDEGDLGVSLSVAALAAWNVASYAQLRIGLGAEVLLRSPKFAVDRFDRVEVLADMRRVMPRGYFGGAVRF